MATATLIAICLSVLIEHSLAIHPQTIISPGAVGRQALADFQNSRHNLQYLPRAIRKSFSYPAIAPVPFSLSLNNLPSELSADAPRFELFGVKALERGLSPQRRFRRQAHRALDLASSHTDGRGIERPVGRVHGFGDLSVTGNSRSHHHVGVSAGVGSVVWRSNNDRHSVGVGATVDHHRGSYHGYRYSSRPSPSVGIGYRMRF